MVRRQLSVLALLIAAVAFSACADATGPKSACQVTAGSTDCIATP